MGKHSGNAAADTTLSDVRGTGQGAKSTSSNLENTLIPLATQEAINPQGYGVAGVNAMNTAAGQSASGSAARARGESTLSAARTGNAGAYTAGADEAGRESTRVMSDAALKTQADNERLKQQQKQHGEGLLAGLDSDQLKLLESSMGAENNATKNVIDASQNNWFNNLLKFMQVGAEGAMAGAKVAAL